MALIPVFGLFALLVSVGGSVGPSTNTSFCTESKECLEYELICKTDEYEVRQYSPTRWVSTDAEAYFMGVGAAMAFRRLFQYITGANEAGIQMEMTAPVLVKIPEETRMWEPAIYTLNFPLPAAYQKKPPAPTNEKLYFTEMPEMNVYVRSYGGWMLSVTSRLHAHLLTKELDRVGACYNHSYHYGVGYDSPLKLLNRHNEVWYVAEGIPVCTDPQEPTPAHIPRTTLTDTTTSLPANAPTRPAYDDPSNTSTNLPADTSSASVADPPASPLPLTLSESAPLLPSNLSSYSASNSSLQPPVTPASSATSDTSLSASSNLSAEPAFNHPPTAPHILLNSTTNSSDPTPTSSSVELQSDVAMGNSTAYILENIQANNSLVIKLDEADQ
ncbi:uncharacterized protein soul5l [Gouania willdenowi]|uniref:Heme-binding protein 1 n=1 Tax=Gouania willdenowi TaxID=441366 RepID=A0A8C5NEP8_GOUWI|nr:uncharacterized protein LOC114463950 [Gouania willdenowi]